MATKTSSKKTNQNYSAKLADGRKVTVKDGVKSYSGSVTNTSKVGDTVNGKKVGYIVGGNAYSSSKNAPGYSDTFEGKGTTSSGNDIYGNVITANKMKPTPKIPIATPAPIDGMFGITNVANAGLAALNGGTYDTKTNQMIPAPTSTQAPADNNQAILNAYLQANAGLEAPSAVNNLKEMEKMLKPKDKLVNSLTGQLNTLNASRDAAMLSLEGQGRGQTQGFVGGEQARINREAAIQAMPIQAQLAIAQDDLESARTYAGQYFQAKMQDETNAYNQKKENNRLVFEFLNAAEQRRVAANEKALDREYAEKQATSKSAEAIALQAIEYGQSSLATKVMGLDTKSPTYAADVRNAMAQLRKPVAATGGGSAWEIKDVNGVSSWVNKNTQEIKPAGGVVGSNLKPVKDLEIRDLNDTWTAKNSIVSIIDDMTKSIEDNGTKIFWGSEAGKRGANKTNLLLAMKNLEKTGALDKGTIDVLTDLIPENEFWATEGRQVSSLNQLKESIVGKTDEFVGSYRGTTAEVDPRTKRIYGTVEPADISNLTPDVFNEVYNLFGVSQSTSTGAFNADQWLK